MEVIKEIQENINYSFNELIDTNEFGYQMNNKIQQFKEEKLLKSDFTLGTLCVLHYMAITKSYNNEIYKIAATVEMLILAFDIIDDIQDKDTDYIWNTNPEVSLNTALFMTIIPSKVLRESTFEYKELAIELLEKYSLLSIVGQQLDLLNSCSDESSYIQMIEKKSGSLAALSCLIGTILASGRIYSYVEEYSKSLGIIQQIKNDIHSLKEWDKHNDLINKKYSLPIIFLFSNSNSTTTTLINHYKSNQKTTIDMQKIKDELFTKGAIRYAICIKNIFKNKALKQIEQMPCSITQDYLKKLMK